MTDNEIIKALECCRKGKCRECCLDEEYLGINECTAELAKAALDLIQRQQERLDRIVEELKRNSWKSPKEPNRLTWLDKAIEIVKAGGSDGR